MTLHSTGSLGHLYAAIKKRFAEVGLETPELDARILVCHALRITHEDFVLQSARQLTDDEIERISALVRQRLQRKPVAKIIGYKEFYGRDFLTSEHTLDPRPDSETLIEAVLDQVKKSVIPAQAGIHTNASIDPRFHGDDKEELRILDLGTGTGCLLLTLLHELPQSNGTGIDQSHDALNVARENALRHGLAGCADFMISDWFAAVTGLFDIIIGNPPYIPSADETKLAADVRDYDPALALYGGKDGLDPYRTIIPQLGDFLKPDGFAVLEVGQGQADHVAKMMKENGFNNIKLVPDLGGIDRVVMGNACNPARIC